MRASESMRDRVVGGYRAQRNPSLLSQGSSACSTISRLAYGSMPASSRWSDAAFRACAISGLILAAAQ